MRLRRLTFDNPWIAAVDAAPRPAHPLLLLAIGVVMAALAVFGGRAAATALMPALQGLVPEAAAPIAVTALFYLCVYAPLWLAALFGGGVEGRPVWSPDGGAPLGLVTGLALGAAGFGVALGASLAIGVLHPADASGATAAGFVFGLVLMAFQVGAEEIFFRGWIQPVLCARLGPSVGLILVALLFAGLHILGGARGGLALLNLLLGGLWFGLLALRTGGLWAPFAAHLAWNWSETHLMGLDPNPGVSPLGALMDFDLAGPGLWSGGEDGLNGSLAATLGLLLLLAVVALMRPRGAAVRTA